MTKDVTARKNEQITKDTIPIIIGRAIESLEKAKTFAEKEEELAKSNIIFEMLDEAKKLYTDLEFELETAKAELVIAMDRTKIEYAEMYKQVVPPKGNFSKVPVSEIPEMSEARTFREKEKAGPSISRQRVAEATKVAAFDKKNPGVREATIRDMPAQKKRVTKGASLRIVKDAEPEAKPKQPRQKKNELTTITLVGVNSKEQLIALESKADMHIVNLRQLMRQMYQILKVDNNLMPGHIFIERLGTLQRIINKFREIYPIDIILAKDHGAWGDRTGAFEGDYIILDEENEEKTE
jgi:hypothetical protein